MALDRLPADLRALYEVHEWRHASAILETDFAKEWGEIVEVLRGFRLCESFIRKRGGSKSGVSGSLDSAFYEKGWEEKSFDATIEVEGKRFESPTHAVDCYKNRVALEIEWNNKDTFYDRDLNNFRLLFELRIISVGVIVTRCDELQEIFDELGRGSSYGASTTHMGKLLPKVEGGGAGGCPLLVFGMKPQLYDEEC
ncbi:MAG: BglII/BstYI family type II restriction endonuclease [Verrucomicrobiaceae bacterium]